MKEFNLDRALAGDPVVTRDGDPITIFTDKSGHPTHQLVGERIGVIDQFALRWTKEGRYGNGTQNTSLDLFMAPIKKQEWGIICQQRPGEYYLSSTIFNTEDDANECSCQPNYVTTVLIREWEE